MDNYTTTTKIAALACLAVLLSGCGGDDKKKEQEQNNCFNNILSLVDCIVSPSGSNGSPSGKPESGVTSAATASFGEYEPNNVLDNANVLSIPIHASGSTAIEGSVHKDDDASDFFIFTPQQTGPYRFSVCEGTCDEASEDDAVYLMVYDQAQTTVESTPIGTISRKEVSAELVAGMAYYVEINGYNADAFAYDYRLTASGD